MANMNSATIFMFFILTTLYSQCLAQTSSCTNTLITLSPCLNYITGNSSTPSSQCCTQLATVVRSSPQCLCSVLNGGGSTFGFNVNQTQALALPNACNVKTPSVSSCNAVSPAADSPSGSPDTPNTVPSRSGEGSKTIPTIESNGSSDAGSIKTSFSLLVFILLAAPHFSIFSTY